MYIKKIALLITVVLLFSCADPSIFENEGEEIAVYTVRNGGLQEYGTPLKVTLDYGMESPDFDTLEITLFNDSGIILLKETLTEVSIESKTANTVKLPSDMEKGLYHIKIRILNSGIPVKEEIRSFFYDSDLYRLESIRSYPPDPVPGEKIVLKADFSAPSSSDPWFRWKAGQQIISEGYASADGNSALLDLLPANGVTAVSVEMYPFKPTGSGFDDFIPFYNTETAVFVSDKNRERSKEFRDNNNYSMLFHFRGEIINEGFAASERTENDFVTVEGSPGPDFKNSLYGYSFGRDDSLTVPYSISFRRKLLAPSTFRIRMLPYSTGFSAADSMLSDYPVYTSGNSRDFRLQIGLKDVFGFYIDVESGSNRFQGECEYPLKSGSEVVDLAVNFYRGVYSTYIVWVVNGKTLKTEKIPFPVAVSESGDTYSRIGGADMLIDEIGVYSSDDNGKESVDCSLYSSFMKNRFNGDFIAADGFDCSSDDSETEAGGFRYKYGYLVLDPGTSAAVFPDLELYDPVEIRTEGKAFLIIEDSKGKKLLEKPVSETEPVSFIPPENENSRLFTIYLANPTAKESFMVDNILIAVKYPDKNNSE